jgi:hypothetical protein
MKTLYQKWFRKKPPSSSKVDVTTDPMSDGNSDATGFHVKSSDTGVCDASAIVPSSDAVSFLKTSKVQPFCETLPMGCVQRPPPNEPDIRGSNETGTGTVQGYSRLSTNTIDTNQTKQIILTSPDSLSPPTSTQEPTHLLKRMTEKLKLRMFNMEPIQEMNEDGRVSSGRQTPRQKKNISPIIRIRKLISEPDISGCDQFVTSSIPMASSVSGRVLCENLCPQLAKELGRLPHMSRYDPGEEEQQWIPPDKHGLENSTRILPAYYLTGKNLHGKIFEIDYYQIILDDIRNFRKLSEYQLSYIRDLPCEDKMQIIELFNQVYDHLEQVFHPTTYQ